MYLEMLAQEIFDLKQRSAICEAMLMNAIKKNGKNGISTTKEELLKIAREHSIDVQQSDKKIFINLVKNEVPPEQTVLDLEDAEVTE